MESVATHSGHPLVILPGLFCQNRHHLIVYQAIAGEDLAVVHAQGVSIQFGHFAARFLHD